MIDFTVHTSGAAKAKAPLGRNGSIASPPVKRRGHEEKIRLQAQEPGGSCRPSLAEGAASALIKLKCEHDEGVTWEVIARSFGVHETALDRGVTGCGCDGDVWPKVDQQAMDELLHQSLAHYMLLVLYGCALAAFRELLWVSYIMDVPCITSESQPSRGPQEPRGACTWRLGSHLTHPLARCNHSLSSGVIAYWHRHRY